MLNRFFKPLSDILGRLIGECLFWVVRPGGQRFEVYSLFLKVKLGIVFVRSVKLNVMVYAQTTPNYSQVLATKQF